MLRLKTKKGNTMVEGLVSICIISMLVFTAFDIYITALRIKTNNKIREEYINVLDAVSKEIIFNKDYIFLEDLILNGRLYIPSSNVNISSIKNNDLSTLFTSSFPNSYPYIKMTITEDFIYKAEIILYYEDKEISCDLYKGKY